MKIRSVLVLILVSLILSNSYVRAEEGMSWAEFMRSTRGNFDLHYTETDEVIGYGEMTLPSGTPVKVRLKTKVDSQDAVEGSDIDFEVAEDVMQSGTLIIRAGTIGKAQIVKAEKAGAIGGAGALTIGEFSVKSVFGDNIYLRGTLASEGKSKQATSIVVGWLICPLFLLMKGEKAELAPGTEKTIYTGSDYRWSSSAGA